MLPKFRDSWSFLYLEHARIEKSADGVYCVRESGHSAIPCAQVALLMLGPGTSVTQAAIHALAESGCTVVWAGEGGIRFYASGTGETRSSRHLLRQAAYWADPKKRLGVVLGMYELRFGKPVFEDGAQPNLQVLRGMEGARVRTAYAQAVKEHGVEWSGRNYDSSGRSPDAVNQALSMANSCLYGICHAAIVSMGLSPSIGFVHTGNILSFVYDVADLYKMQVSVPVAFLEAAQGFPDLSRRVRTSMREKIVEIDLLKRIESDIRNVLSFDVEEQESGGNQILWDPEEGSVNGGINYGETG